MSFTQWYEFIYKEGWHEDYAHLYSFAEQRLNEYEQFCNDNGNEPIWNG